MKGMKTTKRSWKTMASHERKIWGSAWGLDWTGLFHATYFFTQNKASVAKWMSLKESGNLTTHEDVTISVHPS
jgi:hypothetical protein